MDDDSNPGSIGLEPSTLFEDFMEVLRRARLGVREALRDHQVAGNAVAVWRDGGVALVEAEDIVALSDLHETPPNAAMQKM